MKKKRNEERMNSASPSCAHVGCFGNSGGKCAILTSADFGKRGCPFEKPYERVKLERQMDMERRKYD